MSLKALVDQANQEIERTMNYIQQHQEALYCNNLKLHEAAYPHSHNPSEIESKAISLYNQVGSEKWNDIFQIMCEAEYDHFTDWMAENHITDCRKYIGRSSTFTLVTDVDYLEYGKRDTLEGPKQIINDRLEHDFNNGCLYWYVSDDEGVISLDLINLEEYEEAELIEELQYIIRAIYDNVAYSLEDVITIHDYIKGVQENQLEIMIDYVKNEIENE